MVSKAKKRLRKLGLTNKHGANAKTHEKESTKAIQQVHAAFQLQAVAVDDGNGHDRDESVESVESRKLKLLLIDHCNTERHLHKDRELRDTGVPPQSTSA